jgi:hypothetical protein
LAKKIFISLVLISIFSNVDSQDTTTIISKYQIRSSVYGKINESKFDQDRKGYLLFHYDKLKQVNLTNMSYESGSYSTGRLQKISSTVKKDSTLTTVYKWDFKNSYNKQKGTMNFKLTEKKTNYGTEFIFKGTLKDGSTLLYRGYKETDTPNYVIPETIIK